MSDPGRNVRAVDRVDLADIPHTAQRMWLSDGGAAVTVGTTKDGWFAVHSRKGAAWVFRHERAMCDLADQWLARGNWHETGLPSQPAAPTDSRQARP
jgi:hypothetical protein